MRAALALTLASLMCGPVLAQNYINGNQLTEWCRNSSNLAGAYSLAIHDAFSVAARLQGTQQNAFRTCVPDEVTRSQIRDVVCAYLEANPANRHWEAPVLVFNALVDGFPCT
jgi:hypothetical protein